MKRFILFFAVVLLFFSCEKDKETKPVLGPYFKLNTLHIVAEQPNLVSFLFEVQDVDDLFVADKVESDFNFYENSVMLQAGTTDFFHAKDRINLEENIVILIDASANAGANFSTIQQSITTIINNINENQSVALYTFSDNVKVLHHFSQDKNSLTSALNTLSFKGSSRKMYDAILLGSGLYTPSYNLSKINIGHTIVFTSGNDSGSVQSLEYVKDQVNNQEDITKQKKIYIVANEEQINVENLSLLGKTYLPEDITVLNQNLVNSTNAIYGIQYETEKRGFVMHILRAEILRNNNTTSTAYAEGQFESTHLTGKPFSKPIYPNPEHKAEELTASFTASWSCNNHENVALTYDIYIKEEESEEEETLLASNLTTETYQITGLEYSTTYIWRVVVKNEAGLEMSSDLWEFTTMFSPYWKVQNSSTHNPLLDVSFKDENNGVIVGKTGTILTTTNSGQTWIPNYLDVETDLLSVDWQNETNVWAVGDNGLVVKSTDGGSNWETKIISGLDSKLNDIHFKDENTAWIVGASGKIAVTNDGGENWETFTTNAQDLYAVSHHNDISYIVGSTGSLLKENTTNVWTSQLTNSIEKLQDIDFGTNNGFAVGENSTIVRTQDNGNTWDTLYIESEKSFNALDLVNDQIIYIIGDGGDVTFSLDGGENWEVKVLKYKGNTNSLRGIHLINENFGWIVGANGMIWKFNQNEAIIRKE